VRPATFASETLPADVIDTGNAYRVTIDVPGARDEGIEVRPGPAPGTLAIRARLPAPTGATGRPLLIERTPFPPGASHERVLPVAWDADVGQAKTTIEAGVLTVIVPKKQSNP
jgi:HSP20 family molecular chaperone IbpA